MRSGSAILTACLLAPLLQHPLTAQTITDQQAKVARLEAELQAMETRQRSHDSVERAARSLDRLEVGGLTILTDSARSPRLRRGAEQAWSRLVNGLGVQAGDLAGGVIYARLGPRADWSYLLRADGQFAEATAREGADVIEQRLLTSVGSILARRAGAVAARWGGGTFGAQHATDALYARAAIELVTTLSIQARGCNAGDPSACALALGITPVRDPATEWYDAGDRAALVRRLEESHAPWRERPGNAGVSCLEGGDDEACVDYVRRAWANGPPHPPLSTETAMGVLRVAAGLGGDGAFGRFLADTTATLARRLESMAGVPLDSLLHSWRVEADVHRGPPPELPGSQRWTTLFWIVAFGTLSLRGSRWR